MSPHTLQVDPHDDLQAAVERIVRTIAEARRFSRGTLEGLGQALFAALEDLARSARQLAVQVHVEGNELLVRIQDAARPTQGATILYREI